MAATDKTILIADDDVAIVDSIAAVLELSNYEVLKVYDGTSVMQAIKASPDLILLDVMMAGHDGLAVCKQIKRQAATRHIPVIMVSASPNLKISAEECGADAHLEKPFGMEDLLSKVEALMPR